LLDTAGFGVTPVFDRMPLILLDSSTDSLSSYLTSGF
jgi:hypothetical protein